MKTKIIFEPDDFKGCGQMVIRNSFPPESENYSFGITVAYKIGFSFKQKEKYFLVSLADGMIIEKESKEELCKYLNDDKFGYRPMTQEEIQKIVGGHGSRFKC